MVFDPLLADYNEFLSDFILNFACVSMINHLDNRKKTRAKNYWKQRNSFGESASIKSVSHRYESSNGTQGWTSRDSIRLFMARKSSVDYAFYKTTDKYH